MFPPIASATSARTSCSSSSSPTRPGWRWTRSTGAAISAACPGRAISRWPNMARRCTASAIRAIGALKSSTTVSVRHRRRRLRVTGCVRCARWMTARRGCCTAPPRCRRRLPPSASNTSNSPPATRKPRRSARFSARWALRPSASTAASRWCAGRRARSIWCSIPNPKAWRTALMWSTAARSARSALRCPIRRRRWPDRRRWGSMVMNRRCLRANGRFRRCAVWAAVCCRWSMPAQPRGCGPRSSRWPQARPRRARISSASITWRRPCNMRNSSAGCSTTPRCSR